MKLKDFGRIKPRAQILCLLLSAMKTQTQGLLVDQASGTIGENIQNSVILPVTPTVQSFTPSLPVVGYKGPSTYDRGDLFSNGAPSGAVDLWFQEGIVVPEPGAGWLLLLGSGLFVWHRRVGTRS